MSRYPSQSAEAQREYRRKKALGVVTPHGNTKHGHTTGGKNSPEYISYCNMLQRCYYPRHNRWYRYGGRGIKVCDRWLGAEGFINFLKDMGFKPFPRASVERQNNEGDYTPNNCVWSTPKRQRRNTSNTVFVTYEGMRVALQDLCDRFGVSNDTVIYRIRKLKMSVHDALHTPIPMPHAGWFKSGDGRSRGRRQGG